MNDPTLTLKDVEEYDRSRRRLADQVQLCEANISLTARLKKLREALVFYATAWNWTSRGNGELTRHFTCILGDFTYVGEGVLGGQHARDAIIADDAAAAAKGESKGADDRPYHSPPAPAPCTILDARAAMREKPGEKWTWGTGLDWVYRFDLGLGCFQERNSQISVSWRLWRATSSELDATDWRPVVAKCEKRGQEVRRETTI